MLLLIQKFRNISLFFKVRRLHAAFSCELAAFVKLLEKSFGLHPIYLRLVRSFGAFQLVLLKVSSVLLYGRFLQRDLMTADDSASRSLNHLMRMKAELFPMCVSEWHIRHDSSPTDASNEGLSFWKRALFIGLRAHEGRFLSCDGQTAWAETL